jgi:hypothetical protein
MKPPCRSVFIKGKSVTPHLLPLVIVQEAELGATIEEIAIALGIEIEWVRERVEAARLCFAHQVRVVAAQTAAVGNLREAAARCFVLEHMYQVGTVCEEEKCPL